MVGVLVLVDEHIPELPLVEGPHLLVLLQQMDGVEDDIIEVHGVGLPEAALVACIDLRDPGHPPVAGGLHFLGKLVRGPVLILGVGDNGQHRAWLELLVVQPQVLQDVFDDPLAVIGVVDRKIAIKPSAQLLHVPAQDADAGGVEGGGPDVPGGCAAHPLQPLLELTGGLVGKGDGDHRPGGRRLHGAQTPGPLPVLRLRPLREGLQEEEVLLPGPLRDLPAVAAPAEGEQVVHAVDEHGGLAAASPRQQEQRPLGGQHGLALAGVHARVAPGDDRLAGGDVSCGKILCHGKSPSLFPELFTLYSTILPGPGQRVISIFLYAVVEVRSAQTQPTVRGPVPGYFRTWPPQWWRSLLREVRTWGRPHGACNRRGIFYKTAGLLFFRGNGILRPYSERRSRL